MADRVSLDHLGEVGPQPVAGVAGVLDDGVDGARFDAGHHVTGRDLLAHDHQHLGDRALGARLDRVLHLHGLDHDHRAAGVHGVADLGDLDHGALQRRAHVPHAAGFLVR